MYTTSVLAVMLMIAVAFWGYGRTVQRLCVPATPSDTGTTACVGLAAYLAACGFIELTASASPALFIGIIAVGLLLAAMQFLLRGRISGWGNRNSSPPPLEGEGCSTAPPAAVSTPLPQEEGENRSCYFGKHRAPTLILLLLLVLYLALLSNAAWWHFVNSDDAEGYLVMPLRILQTGSSDLDPFLFRRVEAGLGGNNYLYALPLSIFDFPVSHIVDFGLGSLLIALLAGSHANALDPRNTGILAASLSLALAVVVFAPVINLAPDLPAIALIYAAIRQGRRLLREPAIRLGDHVLFGLLIFALVCLRTSYLVPAFAIAASLYLAMLWTRRNPRVVLAALSAFLVVAVFAVPWMVVVHRIAGTPLYPLLGFGTMTHSEVAGFAAPSILAKNVGRILFCYPLAVFGLWAATRARPATQSETFLCILTPLLLLLSVIAQTKYTIFGWRYGYVAVVPLPLFLFVELLAAPAARRFYRTLLPASLALFVIALVHNESWHPDTVAFGQLFVWAAGKPFNPYGQTDATAAREKLRDTLQAMQNAVPPGRLLLVRLEDPFLLDFRRNPVWVMDHPGLCGPPPGVPHSATAAAWVPYLRSTGVAYVAYDYATEAGEPAQLDAAFMNVNGPSYFQEQIGAAAAAAQSVLLDLRKGVPPLYDDGTSYVIPLTLRATAQATGAHGTGIVLARGLPGAR